MARYAVLDNNVVKNIIVAKSKEVAESITNSTCIEAYNVAVGDVYDSEQKTFTKPNIEATLIGGEES